MKIKKNIEELIMMSKSFGLGEKHINMNNIDDFLKEGEYYLAFDTLITQIYEYEIKITSNFYQLCEKLNYKLRKQDITFLEELIN